MNLQKPLAYMQTKIEELDKLLSQTEVRAPAAGTIDLFAVSPGEQFLPGHPVGSLIAEYEYFARIVLEGISRCSAMPH